MLSRRRWAVARNDRTSLGTRLTASCQEYVAWRVVPADFVTTDTGTGVVHQAPAFGEVDFDLLQTIERMPDSSTAKARRLLCSVAPDGTFTAETPDYQGRWVKDCDRDIIRQTEGRGHCCSTRSSTCTTIRSAGGRRKTR